MSALWLSLRQLAVATSAPTSFANTPDPTTNVVAAICVIAVILSVPIVFYALIMGRWCCDQDLQHELHGQQQAAKSPALAGAGAQEPLPEVLLSFRDVSYSVPDRAAPGQTKFLLRNVTGWFEPNTLTAILGASGCGKTTLLTLLADQDDQGVKTGQVFVNGEPRAGNFRRVAAYVMQNDQLLESLTVREALWFACELRLGSDMKKQDKFRVVHETLEELDLQAQADVPTFRLSGGQKRRVTVALELVARPSLVFLDEPTSGLDAGGALKLVQVLRGLASKRRTVVCTIHQPRSDAFSLFDRCLLMNLGCVVYFGPVSGILPHFAPELVRKLGGDKTETAGRAAAEVDDEEPINPADFVLDLTHTPAADGEGADDEHVHAAGKTMTEAELGALWAASELRKQAEAFVARVHQPSAPGKPVPPPLQHVSEDKYASSLLKQAFTLTRRAFVNDTRNPAYIMQWVLGIVMMLFMGMLYCYVRTPDTSAGDAELLEANLEQWGACSQNVSTLARVLNTSAAQVNQTLWDCGQNLEMASALQLARSSLLYQLLASMFFSEMPQVAAVHADRAMLFREHASRSYSTAAWIVSWVSRIAFAGFLKGLVFPPFVYFSAQLPYLAEPYFLFCIFMGTMSMAGGSMALLVGAATPSFETATVAFVVVNVIAQNLCGYFIDQLFIGWWFRWAYYANFFRYTFDGMLYSQALTPEAFNSDPVQYENQRFLAWQYAIIALCLVFAMQIGAFLITWQVASRVGDLKALLLCATRRSAAQAHAAAKEEARRLSSGLQIERTKVWTLDAKPQFVQTVPQGSMRNVLQGLAAASAIQGAHVV